MISPIHIATDGYLLPLNVYTIMSNGYLVFEGQEVGITIEGGGSRGGKKRKKKEEEERRITVSVMVAGEKHTMTLTTNDTSIATVKDVSMSPSLMDKIKVFVRNIGKK